LFADKLYLSDKRQRGRGATLRINLKSREGPSKSLKDNGGSAWESNPPVRLLTRHTGFEVREGHQYPAHFHNIL
jgi:hypothetical protein